MHMREKVQCTAACEFSYQSVHLLQLPALLLHALALHLNHKQQRLLLGLPECTWAAMGLEGGQSKHSFRSQKVKN